MGESEREGWYQIHDAISALHCKKRLVTIIGLVTIYEPTNCWLKKNPQMFYVQISFNQQLAGSSSDQLHDLNNLFCQRERPV